MFDAVRRWFAPDEVRRVGSTPDYRFSLANERTILADPVDRWARIERAMRLGGDLPPSRFPAVLAIVVGLGALVLVGAVLVESVR